MRSNGGGEGESMTEDEKRALRGSRFAPLPPLPSTTTTPRLAHPNGPVATNKAAALAKFLQRKLREPGGLDSIDAERLELAVRDAKSTLEASKAANSRVKHVESFEDDFQNPSILEDLSPRKSKKERKREKRLQADDTLKVKKLKNVKKKQKKFKVNKFKKSKKPKR